MLNYFLLKSDKAEKGIKHIGSYIQSQGEKAVNFSILLLYGKLLFAKG